MDSRRFFSFVLSFAFFAFFVVAFAQQPLPRFRAGANLVNVDAFFSKDGSAVTDLKPDEIEIFEDDQLQKIENFRFVTPARRGAAPTRPNPVTIAEQRAAASDPEARVFRENAPNPLA